jgi:hypothetical protein
MVGTAAEGASIADQLAQLESAAFTALHILDRVPAIFSTREQFAAWRSSIGRGLDVDPLCLVIVGSTGVGVSLSPRKDKFLKPYHEESDVDLAVISPRHFEVAWRWLRSLGPMDRLRARSTDEADLLKMHRGHLVFDGAIATDMWLPLLPFGPKWASVLGRAGTMNPTKNRDVKARLYRDFESLRDYQRLNVERAKASMIAVSDVGTPVT